MSTTLECEWCSDHAKFRIFNRDRAYERYACDRHQAKVRRQAFLDGYTEDDLEECHSLAGPYLTTDLIFRRPTP